MAEEGQSGQTPSNAGGMSGGGGGMGMGGMGMGCGGCPGGCGGCGCGGCGGCGCGGCGMGMSGMGMGQGCGMRPMGMGMGGGCGMGGMGGGMMGGMGGMNPMMGGMGGCGGCGGCNPMMQQMQMMAMMGAMSAMMGAASAPEKKKEIQVPIEPVDSRVRDLCRYFSIDDRICEKLNKAMKTREDFDEDIQALWEVMEKGSRQNRKPVDIILVKIREIEAGTFAGKDLLDPDIKAFALKWNLDDPLWAKLINTMKIRGDKKKSDLEAMDERLSNVDKPAGLLLRLLEGLEERGKMPPPPRWALERAGKAHAAAHREAADKTDREHEQERRERRQQDRDKHHRSRSRDHKRSRSPRRGRDDD